MSTRCSRCSTPTWCSEPTAPPWSWAQSRRSAAKRPWPIQFAGRARVAQPALVDGAVGLVWAPGGRPRVVFAITIARGKIVEIALVADPERLRQLDLVILNQ